MNTFTWKSIWLIRHTDEMRSILEAGSEQLQFYVSYVKNVRGSGDLREDLCCLEERKKKKLLTK